MDIINLLEHIFRQQYKCSTNFKSNRKSNSFFRTIPDEIPDVFNW